MSLRDTLNTLAADDQDDLVRWLVNARWSTEGEVPEGLGEALARAETVASLARWAGPRVLEVMLPVLPEHDAALVQALAGALVPLTAVAVNQPHPNDRDDAYFHIGVWAKGQLPAYNSEVMLGDKSVGTLLEEGACALLLITHQRKPDDDGVWHVANGVWTQLLRGTSNEEADAMHWRVPKTLSDGSDLLGRATLLGPVDARITPQGIQPERTLSLDEAAATKPYLQQFFGGQGPSPKGPETV